MMPNGIEALAQPVVPVSLASEREVLGVLIEDPAIFAEAMQAELCERHFSFDDHRKVFRAILALSEAGTVVNYITVSDALGNKDTDVALIGDLITGCVLVRSHILHLVQLLKKLAYLRNFLDFSQWMQTAACAPSADPEAIEREARANLDRLRGNL
jgi:replicative DNA helicase